MFRLLLSHIQALLKYRSKVNNVHSAFWIPNVYIRQYKKVKQTHYRHGQAQRVPGS